MHLLAPSWCDVNSFCLIIRSQKIIQEKEKQANKVTKFEELYQNAI